MVRGVEKESYLASSENHTSSVGTFAPCVTAGSSPFSLTQYIFPLATRLRFQSLPPKQQHKADSSGALWWCCCCRSSCSALFLFFAPTRLVDVLLSSCFLLLLAFEMNTPKAKHFTFLGCVSKRQHYIEESNSRNNSSILIAKCSYYQCTKTATST